MATNFTLVGIIIIVLLFIPGYFFKRFYFQGRFTRQFGVGAFAERFITSIFWGIIIQSVTLILLGKFSLIPLEPLYNIVSSVFETALINKMPAQDLIDFKKFLLYIIFSNLVAVLLGCFFHQLIRIFRIDMRVRVFRFANHWHYIFKGEIKDQQKGWRKKVVATELDVLTKAEEGKTRMYAGYLSEYTIDKENKLSTITLTEAKRYSSSRKEWKDIEGDGIIIPYENVVNINMRYVVSRKDYSWLKDRGFRFVKFLTSLILLAIPIFIISYFYPSLNIFRMFFGVLFSVLSWLLTLVLLGFIFNEKERSKLNGNENSGILITTFLWLLFIFLSLYSLKLLGDII